jgi:AcrR family transcriptional regulator
MQLKAPKHPPGASQRRLPTRTRLLAAAERVFARDGLDGATTRAIAREAAVNEVTLFRHFGSKERLIEAVMGRAFGGEAPDPSTDAARTGSLRGILDDFARRYTARLEENLPLVRTVIGEIHRHRVCEQQALQGIFQPLRESLVERLQEARRQGGISSSVDATIAADLFAGAIFAGVLRRCKPTAPREYSAEAYRKTCIDTFVRGFAPPSAAEPLPGGR